jgi:hypothetical protein
MTGAVFTTAAGMLETARWVRSESPRGENLRRVADRGVQLA